MRWPVAGTGTLEWIGLRSARRAPIDVVGQTRLLAGQGLEGDHWSGSASGKRQITLIQAEHLPVIAAWTGRTSIDPALLRRNLVVRGINLAALRTARFAIGEAILEGSGHCHPCSRMEEALGPGGYQAMRGHGGITARVVVGGVIRTGDAVRWIAPVDGDAPSD